MAAKEGVFQIEGLEGVYEKDIRKHRAHVLRFETDRDNHKKAQSYLVEKKNYYKKLIKQKKAGGKKWNLESLEKSKELINIDIRHHGDLIKQAQERIEHFSFIVKTLEENYKEHYDLEVK